MINITRRALGVLVIKPAKGGAQLTVHAAGSPAQVKVRLDIARQGAAGPAGPVGPAGSNGATYKHTQSIASTGWTVPHNLNRHPSITTTDNLGNVIHGDVSYVDTNIVQITHGSALIGFAYCN